MVKRTLTQAEKDKITKFVLYPLAALIGALIIYFIFAPSGEEQAKLKQGFNTEITAGATGEMDDDKRKTYSENILSDREQERQTIKDLGSMLSQQDANSEDSNTDDLYLDDRRTEVAPSESATEATNSITKSTVAYREMNKTLGSFYEKPKVDKEKEQMQKRIEELEQSTQVQQQPQMPTMEDQLALLEKSYELAAKYNTGSSPNGGYDNVELSTEKSTTKSDNNGKTEIANIKQVEEKTVSALAQQISDEDFVKMYSEPRNSGFNTAVGRSGINMKNTIAAVVHSDQTITDGGAVRLRLVEPMVAGDNIIPKATIVTGIGKVQGERLYINVKMLQHNGVLMPVELIVADADGQEGIFIPSSMELEAVREVAANLGTNLGTTINLNQQSAGDQILTDLGKGAIQGVSQYIGKKMREVKVHLKAGYQLMLYQED